MSEQPAAGAAGAGSGDRDVTIDADAIGGAGTPVAGAGETEEHAEIPEHWVHPCLLSWAMMGPMSDKMLGFFSNKLSACVRKRQTTQDKRGTAGTAQCCPRHCAFKCRCPKAV